MELYCNSQVHMVMMAVVFDAVMAVVFLLIAVAIPVSMVTVGMQAPQHIIYTCTSKGLG